MGAQRFPHVWQSQIPRFSHALMQNHLQKRQSGNRSLNGEADVQL